MLAGLEGRCRIAEHEAFEAREGHGTLGEGHRGAGLEAGGRDARQPGGRDLGRRAGTGLEDVTGQVQVHFQAVGLDRLDVEALVEGRAAHFDIGVPPAGGILGRSGDGEGVEAVPSRRRHPGIELALGRIELQDGRMAFRDALHLVGEDHRDMEGVTRTPDAALAVDKALEALGDGLSAHIEATHGFLVTVGEPEVAYGLSLAGKEDERLAVDLDLRQALAVGFPRPDALELEIVGFQVHIGCGRRVPDVGGGSPEGIAIGILGEQADIGREEIHDREAVGIHVEGRLIRVVPLFPVIGAPVIEALPPVGVLDIPGRFFLGGRLAVRPDREHLRRILAAIQGILLFEGQADAVDCTRFLPEQAGQVDAVVVPGMEIAGCVTARQGNLAAVDQPSGAAEFGFSVQVVLLQEQENVVLIDFDDSEIHGGQVHGAERQDQVALIRKDVAFQGDLQGRCRVGCRELRPEVLRQHLSVSALDGAVDGEGQALLGIGLVEDPGAVVLDVHGLPEYAGQFEDAFLGGGGGQRLAEAHFHAGIAAPDDPGVDDLEGPGGRDDRLQRVDIAESLDFQGYLDGNVLIGNGDAFRLEAVDVPFPGDRHRYIRIYRKGDVLLGGRDAEPDGTLQPGAVLDGDAVQGEYSRLGHRLDAEREFLAFGFLHVRHLSDLERPFIDGPFLHAFRHELHHGGAQPAFSTLEGGLEGEQAAGLPVQGNRVGQFDPDGGSLRNHAARIGVDIGAEGGIRGFRRLGMARHEGGGKGQKGPKTDATHTISHFLLIQR